MELQLVANIIYALTLSVLIWQVFELRKQRITDLEWRKRQTTINILSVWLKTFERKAQMALDILSLLKKSDIEKIYNYKDIDLNQYKPQELNTIVNLLYVLFPKENVIQDIKKSKKIPAYISAYLNSLTTEYLDTLELIFISWDQNIIDWETFKKEFFFLREEECSVLEIWDSNKKYYPNIWKFCDYLQRVRHNNIYPSKPAL